MINLDQNFYTRKIVLFFTILLFSFQAVDLVKASDNSKYPRKLQDYLIDARKAQGEGADKNVMV